MSEKHVRRPLKNFFIKRSVQLSIITRILLAVLATSLVTTTALALIYKLKSHGGTYYYMGENIDPMELHGILGLILPALIVAQTATLAIAVGIGIFSSRKVAVPLFKLERWAAHLKMGKFNTHLAFRENGEMQDLTVQCNAVTDSLRHIFQAIDHSLQDIETNPGDNVLVSQRAQSIRSVLETLDYHSREPKGQK